MASKPIKRGKYYYFYYWQDGKKKWINTHKLDFKSASNDKTTFELSRFSSPDGIKRNGLWASFVKDYMEYSQANKKRRSVIRDTRTIKTFNNLFPLKHFKDFTFQILNEYKNKRIATGVKHSTVNRELNTLKNMGTMSVPLKYCSVNPVKEVRKFPDLGVTKDRYLSLEEINTLLNGVKTHPLKTICYLQVYAALRIGEAIHMVWNDVDFNKNLIYITPKADWSPKTNQRQIIPLNTKLKAYLLKLKRLGEYICCYDDGTLMTEECGGALMRKRMKELKILNATSHTLRHTCLSWGAMSGISFLSLVKLARHTNPKTTMRYAHLHPDFQANDLNKLPF